MINAICPICKKREHSQIQTISHIKVCNFCSTRIFKPYDKHDAGKYRFSLLPLQPVIETLRVLEFGANKYSPNGWKYVPDGITRYFDALMRHLFAYRSGEKYDPESNLSHLAHAVCCLLFLMELDNLITEKQK
ncbi:dATP/dGTP diphosphohydrolase domain-containing protein [Photorhabdus heterorhabditis]|uniref:dATP/dGTP diphosphohydrolase domain-containing protein n=1 Tax=Photorhabdus heterorhabditis TaxID=880156 RepID=UPI001CB6DDF1|nr:dATP/dGTP diphosphohydrolase domain-containing protein [Photorhabdus heterorhabditis]